RRWLPLTFVTSWPGILIQLLLIPTLVFALMKAHLVPSQFQKV
ncbi:hypothetical protein EVA_13904, partial [gut metagenome]